MPINPSPEYKDAEREYRKARAPADRLRCLQEMLRTIPKHKGTERLQADIKTRIKTLTEDLAGPRKGGGRGGPVQAVHPEGAAQVALIGPPNAGKSSLVARLTGSSTEIGPYPFTTHAPVPAMLPHEDVLIQLVDLPPISAEFMEPWFPNALQTADAALLVVDLADPETLDHIVAIRERLAGRHVTLDERWPFPLEPPGEAASPADAPLAAVVHAEDAATADASAGGDPGGDDEMEDPFRVQLPTLLVANKSDLDPDPEEVEVLEELLGVRFPAVAVSAQTGRGLEAIGPVLFRGLGIVRVYTKIPGKPADMGRPYTLRHGDTALDLARHVHKDLAGTLKFARIWGSGVFEGQQVGTDHALADGDVVELHA
jgi:ribosome-interacting GTPase 1